VFGPMRRLENQLQSIIEGREKFLSIKVREADAFYDIFHKINTILGRLKG